MGPSHAVARNSAVVTDPRAFTRPLGRCCRSPYEHSSPPVPKFAARTRYCCPAGGMQRNGGRRNPGSGRQPDCALPIPCWPLFLPARSYPRTLRRIRSKASRLGNLRGLSSARWAARARWRGRATGRLGVERPIDRAQNVSRCQPFGHGGTGAKRDRSRPK